MWIHIEQIRTANLIYMYLFESDLIILLFLLKKCFVDLKRVSPNSIFFLLNKNRHVIENKIISKMYLHYTVAILLWILVFQMHWVAFLRSPFCSLQFLHAHLTVSPNKVLFNIVAKLRQSRCGSCYFVKSDVKEIIRGWSLIFKTTAIHAQRRENSTMTKAN